MNKSILSTTLVLALTALAAQASAAEPDEAAKQQARELMAQGRKSRDTADLRAALSSFSQADEIMRVPTTGLEVARTLLAFGRLVEAAKAAERVLTLPEAPDDPDAFAKAREAARELGRELEARTPRLRVAGVTAQTRLTLDGIPLEGDVASEGARVNPGRHVLVAEQGGKRQTRAVEVSEAAGNVDVTFDLAPARPAPTPERPARKSSKTRGSTIAIYGLGGLAVAGVGGGIGLMLGANARKSDLEKTCAPHCREDAVDQLHTTYVLSNVAMAVGAASAAAALTIYLARPSDAELRRRQAALTSLSFGPSSAGDPGVTLSGTF